MTPTQRRRHGRAALALFPCLLAALSLTGCGEQRADSAASPSGTAASPSSTAAPPSDSAISADPETGTTAASPSAAGASPYVEPGTVDGAPHHGENNAYRRPGKMSQASEEAAQAEVRRMEPVLKRLWTEGDFDPASVRTALRKLGYRSDELTVQEMHSRYADSGHVTPEGALIGLRVREDACVTGFVQKSNYGVQASGPFPETGCITPRRGH